MTLTQFEYLHSAMGGKWFTNGMAFLKSRIISWNNKTGFFIVSEGLGQSKKYTIRRAIFSSGDIMTFNETHTHTTLLCAREHLRFIETND